LVEREKGFYQFYCSVECKVEVVAIPVEERKGLGVVCY